MAVPVISSCQKIFCGSSIEIDQLLDDIKNKFGVKRKGFDSHQQQSPGQQSAQKTQNTTFDQEWRFNIPGRWRRQALK